MNHKQIDMKLKQHQQYWNTLQDEVYNSKVKFLESINDDLYGSRARVQINGSTYVGIIKQVYWSSNDNFTLSVYVEEINSSTLVLLVGTKLLDFE